VRSIFLPDSIDELWEMLRQHPEAAVYAGGTDLLVRMRKGVLDPSCLICLERIGALKGVREEGDEIIIGACTSHARLLENQVIRSRLPVLIQALRQLGSPHIRNMGTIGGNIATASPAGDTLPPLYALGAGVEIVSS
jgi:CO/xanthine dehydrogenase FAD-binding subunit